MKKVLFLDTVHPILEERLTQSGFVCIDATEKDYSTCQQLARDAAGIVIRSRFKMNESFLKEAAKLNFIARSGAGMENIDVEYCEKREIRLYNAPEGNRDAVGEHAVGMLLSLMNKLHTADREVRSGKWRREANRGTELGGKTVGIIGFGNNGSAFAQKLSGFNVSILAYDKYKTGFATSTITESTLENLLQKADVISFHIPQNEETICFADDSFFDQLSNPVFLLNLSRGKVVKTSALVHALKKGIVLGAGLDVLEYESSSFESFLSEDIPNDLSYLLNAQNVMITPHVGGWTQESYFKLSNVLADKILAEL